MRRLSTLQRRPDAITTPVVELRVLLLPHHIHTHIRANLIHEECYGIAYRVPSGSGSTILAKTTTMTGWQRDMVGAKLRGGGMGWSVVSGIEAYGGTNGRCRRRPTTLGHDI